MDPPKNAKNIAERQLPFDLVADLDWETAVALEDTRQDYGARRIRVLALLGSRLHVAVITHRGDAVHVISFRKANAKEVRRYGKKDSGAASRPDEENLEWTRDDIQKARPAFEVISELFGPEPAAFLKRGRGRPEKTTRKINQTLRLDADVLKAYRGEGPGWQARINRILRENMPGGLK